MFNEKKHKVVCLFQLFKPLDLQPVALKTLEQSISYNPSHRPDKKGENAISATLCTICLQQHKSAMTFKVLL